MKYLGIDRSSILRLLTRSSLIISVLTGWGGPLQADSKQTHLKSPVTADISQVPNVIFLMADDLGYRDLSAYGGEAVQTPHLDALASEGIRMTQFYSASAVCSPTRASVLTGRYPQSFGITKHLRANVPGDFLPASATTIAELFASEGYTTIHAGKWHLGGLKVSEDGRRMTEQPGPSEHGFQHYLCQIEQRPARNRMLANRTLYRQGGQVLIRDGRRVTSRDPSYTKHLTNAIGDYSIEMIQQSHAQNKPFFLNVWWLVPHTPYEPAPEPYWSITEEEGISDDQHRFRSMVRHMDAKIGEILSTLDDLGISDNTIVVFSSDNGAAYEGNIGKLKGGKTDLHEGGIRVPMIVRWPNRINPGTVSPAFGHTNDILPTLCDAANVPIPKEKELDGLSLLPHLLGQAAPSWEQRNAVFWQLDLYPGLQRHYPKPKPFATEAVRLGEWKLLARDGQPVELFNIAKDPFEENNLLNTEPELAEELTTKLGDQLDEWGIANKALR